MALVFYAAKTRSGERQAQLPLTIEGELGTTISTFSSATFILDTNSKTCPANFNDLLEPHLMSIVAVERDDATGYSKPIWMGMINDTPSNSDGRLSITCASLEWYLTTRRAKDCRFEPTNDIMDIPTALIAQVEKDSVGIGLRTDCPASGTKRALVIRESDGQSVVDVLAALDLEWTIALDWADAGQAVVTKTFMCRYPRLGNIIDHPEFMVASPGNVFHWDYTAPMTEGKTATYVVAVGDGTGDLRTTSLPKVDATREGAGYPRVEMYKSFQGVTNVNDADVLADQVSKEVFTRTHAVTTTVRNQGITTFRGITLGSTVRVIIADRGIDEVWRFVGWLMDAQGQFWKPTLGRLAEKVKAFPRAAMPNDTGRALVDMSGRVSLAGYQDPLANGYKFPAGPDGKAFTIDPIAGFGHTDALGAFSAFGSADSIVSVAKVASRQTSDRKAQVYMLGSDGTYATQETEVKYLYSYTPIEDDIVGLIQFNKEWVAIGAIAVDPRRMFAYEHREIALSNEMGGKYRCLSDNQYTRLDNNPQSPTFGQNVIVYLDNLRFRNKLPGDGGGTPVTNRGAKFDPSSGDMATPAVVDDLGGFGDRGGVQFNALGTYQLEVQLTFAGGSQSSTYPELTAADLGIFIGNAGGSTPTYEATMANMGTGDTINAIFTFNVADFADPTAPASAAPQVPLFLKMTQPFRSQDPNNSSAPADEWLISTDPAKTWLKISRVA